MRSLKERFEKEIDFDGAMYELGAMLGFWPEACTTCKSEPITNIKGLEEFQRFNCRKWIFLTNNPVGNCLSNMLDELVKMGALIESKDNLSFIARQDFDPDAQDQPHAVNQNGDIVVIDGD